MSYLNVERIIKEYETYLREHSTPELIEEAKKRALENPNGRVIVVPRSEIQNYLSRTPSH